MSIYCPLAEALGIETSISIHNIPYEANESIDKEATSKTSKAIQKWRVEEGIHNFQDKEWASIRTQKLLSNGTHPFQRNNFQKNIQNELVKANKHHLLGGVVQQKQLESGQHPSQIEHTCPHCGKVGKGGGMLLWHFDKCKKRV